MNKTQLIALAAAHADLDKKTVAKVIDGLLTVVPMAVAAGEQVSLVGFGTFEAVRREARTGRNPQTGEPVEIPATRVPKFRPGTRFKDAVAKGARLEPVAA